MTQSCLSNREHACRLPPSKVDKPLNMTSNLIRQKKKNHTFHIQSYIQSIVFPIFCYEIAWSVDMSHV